MMIFGFFRTGSHDVIEGRLGAQPERARARRLDPGGRGRVSSPTVPSTPISRADNGSLPMVAYRMPPALAVRVHSKSSFTAAGMASLAAPEGAGKGGPRPNAESHHGPSPWARSPGWHRQWPLSQ